jgi:hypothetical protein
LEQLLLIAESVLLRIRKRTAFSLEEEEEEENTYCFQIKISVEFLQPRRARTRAEVVTKAHRSGFPGLAVNKKGLAADY